MKMKNLYTLILLTFVVIHTNAQEKSREKLETAIDVVNDIALVKEGIPKMLIDKAEAIVIVPKLINAGFVVGGERGRGLAMVKHKSTGWGSPVFVNITGGSVGAQIGVQSTDLILIFMNRSTLYRLNKSEFTLGGEISVAAGPVGRSSGAKTNEDLSAEVYTYSRSRGMFAGISIEGSVIKVDKKLNKDFYGKKVSDAEEKLKSTPPNSSAELKELISILSKI